MRYSVSADLAHDFCCQQVALKPLEQSKKIGGKLSACSNKELLLGETPVGENPNSNAGAVIYGGPGTGLAR